MTASTTPRPSDIRIIVNPVKAKLTLAPVDDSSFFKECLIKLPSELPSDSENGNLLNDEVIQRLYDDLKHPPTGTVSTKDNIEQQMARSMYVSLFIYYCGCFERLKTI